MNPSTETIDNLVTRIKQSDLYKAYENAFRSSTGLPLAIVPARGTANSLRSMDDPCENRFCKLLNRNADSPCRQCVRASMEVLRRLPAKVQALECFAGLRETMVPVKLGETVVAYLKTGQIRVASDRVTEFNSFAGELRSEGYDEALLDELRAAYYETRALEGNEYQGMVTLLAIFSIQLGNLVNRLMLEQDVSQPSIVSVAKRFIKEHLNDPINLEDVAKIARVSTYYFCKVFKKATGLTFTQYVNRKRIEHAKQALLRQHLSVTTVAYDVGYQSLSQFNRNFLRYVGESPTSYRKRQRQTVQDVLQIAC